LAMAEKRGSPTRLLDSATAKVALSSNLLSLRER
jgi:hypothetical protein